MRWARRSLRVAAVERARDDHAVEFAMMGQYPPSRRSRPSRDSWP